FPLLAQMVEVRQLLPRQEKPRLIAHCGPPACLHDFLQELLCLSVPFLRVSQPRESLLGVKRIRMIGAERATAPIKRVSGDALSIGKPLRSAKCGAELGLRRECPWIVAIKMC